MTGTVERVPDAPLRRLRGLSPADAGSHGRLGDLPRGRRRPAGSPSRATSSTATARSGRSPRPSGSYSGVEGQAATSSRAACSRPRARPAPALARRAGRRPGAGDRPRAHRLQQLSTCGSGRRGTSTTWLAALGGAHTAPALEPDEPREQLGAALGVGAALLIDFGYDVSTGLTPEHRPHGEAASPGPLRRFGAIRRRAGRGGDPDSLPRRPRRGLQRCCATSRAPRCGRPRTWRRSSRTRGATTCRASGTSRSGRPVARARAPVRWREYELTLVSAARAHALRGGDRVRGRRPARARDRRPADRRRHGRSSTTSTATASGRRLHAERRSSTARCAPSCWSAATGPQEVTDEYLDRLDADGRRLAELHRELLPEDVDFGAEGFGARGSSRTVRPWRRAAARARRAVRNPFDRRAWRRSGSSFRQAGRAAARGASSWPARRGGRPFVGQRRARGPARPRRRRPHRGRDAVRPAGRGAGGRGVTDRRREARVPARGLGRRAHGDAPSAGWRSWAPAPLAALDTVAGGTRRSRSRRRGVEGDAIVVERRSTRWERASVSITCTEDADRGARVGLRARRADRGAPPRVRSLLPERPTGLPAERLRDPEVAKLFSPSPARRDRRAAGVRVGRDRRLGDGEPGRDHWFFTPAAALRSPGATRRSRTMGWTSASPRRSRS